MSSASQLLFLWQTRSRYPILEMCELQFWQCRDSSCHAFLRILAVSRLHLIDPSSIEHKCLFSSSFSLFKCYTVLVKVRFSRLYGLVCTEVRVSVMSVCSEACSARYQGVLQFHAIQLQLGRVAEVVEISLSRRLITRHTQTHSPYQHSLWWSS